MSAFAIRRRDLVRRLRSVLSAVCRLIVIVGSLLGFTLPAAAQIAVRPTADIVVPDGFDSDLGNPKGTVSTYYYLSSTLYEKIRKKLIFVNVAVQRPVVVYTPPRYPTEGPYPVLYLLHGRFADETYWTTPRQVDVTYGHTTYTFSFNGIRYMLDNLIAQKKVPPMIVVMPDNFDSQAVDIKANPLPDAEADAAYELFEDELLDDLIPFIDSNFMTAPFNFSRALAGASMGGEQALKFGLAHLDTFSDVGAFAPGAALTSNGEIERLIPVSDIAAHYAELDLLWLSCGVDDAAHLTINTDLSTYLTSANIPHLWRPVQAGHDTIAFVEGLYLMLPHLFQPIPL